MLFIWYVKGEMIMDNRYWRPFKRVKEENEINIVKGEYVYLYDDKNNRYIDGYSGLWNMNFGYNDDEIKVAIKKQLDTLPYINPITLNLSIASRLSKRLCEITHQDIEKVLYTCSGSESIELAIKFVRKYQHIKKSNKIAIAVLHASYHGTSYGAISASMYNNEFIEGYKPLLEKFVGLPVPFCRCCKGGNIKTSCKYKMLEELKTTLEKHKKTIGGIIIEPVIASGGVIPLFKEYLEYIVNFCQENDVLFVCDEVATGFGRTGELFYFHKYNLKPDLIALSKGINNGYLPLGALCVSKKIVSEFAKNEEFINHLSTQNGNPISIAAANATISKFDTSNMLDGIHELSELTQKILIRKLGKIEAVHDIRVVGLMIAIDIINPHTKGILSLNKLAMIQNKIMGERCLIGTSYTKNITSSLLFFPAYIMKKKEITAIANIIRNAILDEVG